MSLDPPPVGAEVLFCLRLHSTRSFRLVDAKILRTREILRRGNTRCVACLSFVLPFWDRCANESLLAQSEFSAAVYQTQVGDSNPSRDAMRVKHCGDARPCRGRERGSIPRTRSIYPVATIAAAAAECGFSGLHETGSRGRTQEA